MSAMKRIAVVLLLLLSTTRAHAIIRCQDAPGREQGVHWWWREVDGNRCSSMREGRILAAEIRAHLRKGRNGEGRDIGRAGAEKTGAEHPDADSQNGQDVGCPGQLARDAPRRPDAR